MTLQQNNKLVFKVTFVFFESQKYLLLLVIHQWVKPIYSRIYI